METQNLYQPLKEMIEILHGKVLKHKQLLLPKIEEIEEDFTKTSATIEENEEGEINIVLSWGGSEGYQIKTRELLSMPVPILRKYIEEGLTDILIWLLQEIELMKHVESSLLPHYIQIVEEAKDRMISYAKWAEDGSKIWLLGKEEI